MRKAWFDISERGGSFTGEYTNYKVINGSIAPVDVKLDIITSRYVSMKID
jgi:hypothetical protein